MIYTKWFGEKFAGKIFQEIVWNGANENKVINFEDTINLILEHINEDDKKVNQNLIKDEIIYFLNQTSQSEISEYFVVSEDLIILKKDFTIVRNIINFKEVLYKYIKFLNQGHIDYGIQTRFNW